MPFKEVVDISEWAAAAAKWRGDVPEEVDVDAITQRLNELRRQRAAIEGYERDSVNLRKDLELYTEQVTLRQQELEGLTGKADHFDYRGELQVQAQRIDETSSQVREIEVRERELRDAFGRAKAERAAAKERLQELKTREQKLKDDMKEVAKSNELLKAVRAARPIIADKMWNAVLHTVSRYFSQMRGEASTVTRTTDGFKVDGHSVAGLSGSTLDILGLAIRVALVRTFLPTSPFLVLDEPAAACDVNRTQAMLGFLATTEFDQILACSHDEISEAVADNVVKI